MTPEPSGSSPLTRGKLTDLIPALAGIRLIPAHAGKTKRSDHTDPGPAAHPRSRGENTADDALTAQPAGSSPLTRGKQPSQRSRCTAMRLIPAHAGKTLAVPLVETIQRAHPRSRGENHCRLDVDISIGGSSPLTRGKRPLIGLFWPVSRLIPAHAGKTSSSQAGGPRCRAHPRSRGENVRKRSNGIYTLGSSPLTRGKRFNVGAGLRITRLIPAHAGKTLVGEAASEDGGAHPRSRGENASDLGSIPSHGWLIPAHAGKTSFRFSAGAFLPAHPRSRGENSRR